MKRPVKSYAQRSAAHLVPQDHLWERSMRQLIRDNFDLIESDIRRIGAVNIIRHLENERDELFNAFLDEQEQKARARLERSADDVDARRALEAIDHARTHRPYEAIKTHSFEQTLSVERKERRAAGTYHHTKPHRSKPTNTTSAHIAALKQFGRPESRAPRPSHGEAGKPNDGAAVDQPAPNTVTATADTERFQLPAEKTDQRRADDTTDQDSAPPTIQAALPEGPAGSQPRGADAAARSGADPTGNSQVRSPADADEDEATPKRVR